MGQTDRWGGRDKVELRGGQETGGRRASGDMADCERSRMKESCVIGET